METQVKALTILLYFCPRSGRFWARELRVSQQISTFYGSSVQAMDA
jgi:hypothetical protein